MNLPEIADFHAIAAVDQKVRGLEIAVENPLAVQEAHSSGGVEHHRQTPIGPPLRSERQIHARLAFPYVLDTRARVCLLLYLTVLVLLLALPGPRLRGPCHLRVVEEGVQAGGA